MKTLIIALSIAFTTQAQARTLNPETFVKTAQILTFDFDQDSSYSQREFVGGEIRVNAVTRHAVLTLQPAYYCPPNALCAPFVESIKIELPITNVEKDGCNIRTYTAMKDERPVDGSLKELVIKDYSHSPCEMVYVAPTTIQYTLKYYDRLHGRGVEQNSRFTADELKSPFIR